MRKMQFSEIGKWVLFFALCSIGTISFMILAGEEDPYDPMPLGTFFLYKFGALGVIGLCIYIGKKLYAAGMLPKRIIKEIEEE